MDQLKQVKFCNGYAYKYEGRVTKLQDYNLRLNENYNPLQDHHISLMCKYPFSWSFLPKGLGYYIYITSMNGSRVTYFIERKVNAVLKRARVYVMNDIFKSAPTESIMSAYIVNCKKGPKWKFMLQDIYVEGGKKLYGNYGERWNKMVLWLENADTQNETISWKILPMLQFPISIDILKTIHIEEGINISRIIMYNMSTDKTKQYVPFIVKYDEQNMGDKEEVLDISKQYKMKIVPNELYPDLYKLMRNSKIIGNACVRTIEQSLKMQELCKNEKCEAEFYYNVNFQGWEIIV